jgi:hypothetical protein
MNEQTTDKEWADYLCAVLAQLDKLAERDAENTPSLRKNVDEVREPLGHLIGHLIG